jgi:hypothetical protein
MMGMKRFKTEGAAGKFAAGVLKNYGYNASVFKETKNGKSRYAVINPRSIGLKKL